MNTTGDEIRDILESHGYILGHYDSSAHTVIEGTLTDESGNEGTFIIDKVGHYYSRATVNGVNDSRFLEEKLNDFVFGSDLR